MTISSSQARQAFAGKRILVGVTGGIAAYKTAELVRQITKAGGEAHVVMTEAATRFITPLTLETLSGHPVRTDMWALRGDSSIAHTELGREMDAAIVAPATADFLGRLAGGLADQLLLNVLMASKMPVLLCPAMNAEMWDNPLVQQNVALLGGLSRYRFVSPDAGWLACRVVGKGRLPDAPVLMSHLARLLAPQDLAGKCVVVTAGPTREWLDPVRFLSNPSTGKMGYAVAEAAWERGAEVILISGPTDAPAPEGVEVRGIGTTEELLSEVRRAIEGADLLVMAAAPADWKPAVRHAQKQKKTAEDQALALTRTPDVLASIRGSSATVVGFAAETENLMANASDKARRKGLDLIFVNHVGDAASGTGFAGSTNGGTLLDGQGQVVAEVPVVSKAEVAHRLLDAVVARWR